MNKKKTMEVSFVLLLGKRQWQLVLVVFFSLYVSVVVKKVTRRSCCLLFFFSYLSLGILLQRQWHL